MLIDRFLPRADVVQRHELLVASLPARAWHVVRTMDLGRDPAIRALLAFRGFRGGSLTLDGAVSRGFLLLDEDPPHEIVLGLVGRFWRFRSDLRRPRDFAAFDQPGFLKAAWSWDVAAAGPRACVVGTETRVLATDAMARKAFGRYWRAIGPFSALIRRRALALVRREAERAPEPQA